VLPRAAWPVLAGGALLLAIPVPCAATLGGASTIRLSDGGLSRESSLEWRPRPRAGFFLNADSYDSPGWGGDYRVGCGLQYRLVPRRFTLDVGPGASLNAAPGLSGQLSLDAAVRARYGILFAEATGLFFRDGLFCPSLAGLRVRVWRRLRLHLGGGGYYVTDYHSAGFTFTAAAGASYGP
jgi:hypothetical protein